MIVSKPHNVPSACYSKSHKIPGNREIVISRASCEAGLEDVNKEPSRKTFPQCHIKQKLLAMLILQVLKSKYTREQAGHKERVQPCRRVDFNICKLSS